MASTQFFARLRGRRASTPGAIHNVPIEIHSEKVPPVPLVNFNSNDSGGGKPAQIREYETAPLSSAVAFATPQGTTLLTTQPENNPTGELVSAKRPTPWVKRIFSSQNTGGPKQLPHGQLDVAQKPAETAALLQFIEERLCSFHSRLNPIRIYKLG